jgi:uncharacterized membrane protein HdeD (DUF308 family)
MPTIAERNWWVVLLSGLSSIAFGVLVVAWPGLTLRTLITLFGVFAIAYGIIYGSASLAGTARNRWSGLLVGLAAVVAGIIALVWPALPALTLLYIIAAWAIAAGVFELVASFETSLGSSSRGLLALMGVVAIGFGVLLFARPLSGALAVLWAIGTLSIANGFLRCVHAAQLATAPRVRARAEERRFDREEPPMRRAA